MTKQHTTAGDRAVPAESVGAGAPDDAAIQEGATFLAMLRNPILFCQLRNRWWQRGVAVLYDLEGEVVESNPGAPTMGGNGTPLPASRSIRAL